MIKTKLHKAVLAVLGGSMALGLSNDAMAFTSSSIGTYTGSTISINSTAPYKSFSDYQAKNQGWVHTSRYFTLQIGSAADISNGVTYDVALNMIGRGTLNLNTAATANAINNPAFVVWTAGTGAINTAAVSGSGHGWNPTRGISEQALDVNGNTSTVLTNTMMGAAGVLSGHAGWVGYVNSGPTYTLINSIDPLGGQAQSSTGAAVNDTVSHGALNTSSLAWLTNPAASSTAYSDNYYRSDLNTTLGTSPDFAMMTLYGLKSGNYLIALGGACPGYASDTLASNACGNDNQFTFTVSAAPAPVPLPGAVWLFGGALMGYLGIQRRKSNHSI